MTDYILSEQSCGAAIKSFPLPREELFITTKVGACIQTEVERLVNGLDPQVADEVKDIRVTLKRQLAKLQIDYVDLYLMCVLGLLLSELL